jgi:hypothetical protein
MYVSSSLGSVQNINSSNSNAMNGNNTHANSNNYYHNSSNGNNNNNNNNNSNNHGINHPLLGSDSSSSSDDDDLMDEDTDEPYVTTPQVANRNSMTSGRGVPAAAAPWLSGASSPAVNSLRSFQQRQRPRRRSKNKTKLRAPLGLGFGSSSSAAAATLSRSPPSTDVPAAHSRRESISWQANQLHISGTGSEGEDGGNHRNGSGESGGLEGVLGTTPGRDRPVIRRVVTRRGNLLVRLRASVWSCPATVVSPRECDLSH